MIAGLTGRFITWIGVVELGIFAIFVYLASHSENYRLRKFIFILITTLLVLAFATHRLPDFNNPMLVAKIKFSANAMPFSQYANFDKATIGLILLGLLCKLAKFAADWRGILQRSLPIPSITTTIAILASLLLGFV
ncbi:MAG: hypothetical protein H7240_02600 [Glaciimonas sp.]|nr:hypothetical protein [Glaciimonas sp.]